MKFKFEPSSLEILQIDILIKYKILSWNFEFSNKVPTIPHKTQILRISYSKLYRNKLLNINIVHR